MVSLLQEKDIFFVLNSSLLNKGRNKWSTQKIMCFPFKKNIHGNINITLRMFSLNSVLFTMSHMIMPGYMDLNGKMETKGEKIIV